MAVRAHRREPQTAAPLRAVDDVLVVRDGAVLLVQATKAIDAGDPYLQGHFPDLPIFPGVFMVEALCQAVAIAVGDQFGGGDPVGPPILAALRSVRFTAPLLAGDVLHIDARIEAASQAGGWAVDAECRRSDGRLAARVSAEFHPGNGDV
jgi:3-hydroxyacyl-[acyl-carrier-protein] dehydratase